ncbi:MAG TPA: hypothetical protein VLU96_07650 [Gaiellaceae bacterium]|nr:hypothetical protein [Gaiellaceae bacterium]
MDTTLQEDLLNCPGNGLVVEGGATLDLNGHTTSGSGVGSSMGRSPVSTRA